MKKYPGGRVVSHCPQRKLVREGGQVKLANLIYGIFSCSAKDCSPKQEKMTFLHFERRYVQSWSLRLKKEKVG